MAYNYLSGEPATKLQEGRPLFMRSPGSRFDLAPPLMRTHPFASLATNTADTPTLIAEGVLRLLVRT